MPSRVGSGRKGKTAAVVKLTGRKSDRAIKNNGNIAESGRPDAPPYVKDRQAMYYNAICDELEKLGALSKSFQVVVAMLAIRLSDVEALTEFVRQNGRTYTSANAAGGEMHRPYPEVSMLNEAIRHTHTLTSELGLTPSAVGRLAGMKTANEKDDWDGL